MRLASLAAPPLPRCHRVISRIELEKEQHIHELQQREQQQQHIQELQQQQQQHIQEQPEN